MTYIITALTAGFELFNQMQFNYNNLIYNKL